MKKIEAYDAISKWIETSRTEEHLCGCKKAINNVFDPAVDAEIYNHLCLKFSKKAKAIHVDSLTRHNSILNTIAGLNYNYLQVMSKRLANEFNGDALLWVAYGSNK